MTTDVVTLIGNPRAGSRTRTLADTVTSALVARVGADLAGSATLELSDVVGVSFSPDEPARPTSGLPDPHALVRGARLLIVATPAYKGSYTGLLKVFLDQVKPGDLAGAVAVAVAVAASDDHLRQLAAALDLLLADVGARVPAPAVALHEARLGDAETVVAQWVDTHAKAIAEALGAPR